MKHEQVLAIDSEGAIGRLTTSLIEQGCRVERSFDLRSALTSRNLAACPYHGRAACECQFIVLLVHDQLDRTPPAIITAHECEGFTRLKFESLSTKLWSRLMATLAVLTECVMAEA
ncbi:hypothetical protein ANRL1_04407 [Anaerolineae bacterium]|nr:hypothetical protein ANRL1_04407 [Anaerolineae bacterium]